MKPLNPVGMSLFLILSTTASASIMLGNPTSGIVLVAGPKTEVVGVQAHRCEGATQSITVDEVLTVNDTVPVVFAQDTFCSIDLVVRWTSGGSTSTVPVDGFDAFKAEPSASTVWIELDASTQTAELN